MIDHNRQVIFTHIARCGGTTIEKMFVNDDWWNINSHTKHIPAQVAERLYYPYWEQYYKFTIVRNPFERIRSMWKYADHYGLDLDKNGEIILDRYIQYWATPKYTAYGEEYSACILEHHRHTKRIIQPQKLNPFWRNADLDLHTGSAYQNLIESGYGPEYNIEVFKFEEFPAVLEQLGKRFNLPQIAPVEKSTQEKPRLSLRAIADIQIIHKLDFEKYGYSPEYSN